MTKKGTYTWKAVYSYFFLFPVCHLLIIIPGS